MPTEILGDFELYTDQLIGKGAWGEVYKGRQISLDRPVAIKILRKELTQDNEFVRRFLREATCLAKLIDEHIIQIYAAGKHRNSHYFVMEYVQGLPLQKFVERNREFTVDEIIYITTSVARALKTAWDSPGQIIHRDIKPSNIMVSFSSSLISRARPPDASESLAFMNFDIKESRIKVMDFGLAKVAKGGGDATLVGTVIGTPKYISPEAGQGQSVDIRSDIYSLGIIMYEMATGRIPFEAETVVSLIRHHIYDTPLAPSQVKTEIPASLEAVIVKCIQKDPDNRYNHPDELLEDLEAVRQERSPVYAKDMMVAAGAGATIIAKPAGLIKKTLTYIVGTILLILLMGAVGFATLTIMNKHQGVLKWGRALLVKLELIRELARPSRPSGTIPSPETPARQPDEPAWRPDDPEEDTTQNLASLKARAEHLIDTESFPEAHRILNEAFALAPEDNDIKQLLRELNRKEKARLASDKIILQENEYKKYFNLGMDRKIAGNWEGAMMALKQAMAVRDTPAVKKALQEVLKKAEAQAEYNKLLGQADKAEEQGDYEKAIELYKKSKGYTDDIKEPKLNIDRCRNKIYNKWYQTGIQYLHQKKLINAEKAFNQALKHKVGDKDVLNKIAEIKAMFPPGMVLVEEGEFIMGKAGKKTTLASFFIDKYEVTNQKYKEFLDYIKKTNDHNKCHPEEKATERAKDHTPEFWKGGEFPPGEASQPVVGIDWYDAYAYARWRGKRLPAETEWEKAARGTTGQEFPWGASEKARVNIKGRGKGAISSVGKYPDDKSPFGCFDMGGNVSEWTFDDFSKRKVRKAVRGGNWYDYLIKARSYERDCYPPFERNKYVGFRCVKDVE